MDPFGLSYDYLVGHIDHVKDTNGNDLGRLEIDRSHRISSTQKLIEFIEKKVGPGVIFTINDVVLEKFPWASLKEMVKENHSGTVNIKAIAAFKNFSQNITPKKEQPEEINKEPGFVEKILGWFRSR